MLGSRTQRDHFSVEGAGKAGKDGLLAWRALLFERVWSDPVEKSGRLGSLGPWVNEGLSTASRSRCLLEVSGPGLSA